MNRQHVATSIVGLVRHLALYHVNRAYEFYLTGTVPERKRATPEEVDRAIIDKYRIAMSKYARHRQRRAGAAAVAYYRLGNFWVMVATCGKHRFFEDNAGSIKSFRRQPLVYGGYSIGIKNDRLHVRLADEYFREIRGYLVNQAVHRSAARLAKELYELPVEPFGPVQRQLRKILREVNAERKSAGMPRVPGRAIPCRLRVVRLTDRDAENAANASVASLLQISGRDSDGGWMNAQKNG
jgi:hypothetical protein